MTVAFFSIFFTDTYGLSPASIAGIFAAAPLAIAALSAASLPLNRAVGRATACVLLGALGTACLFALTVPLPVEAAVVLYLLRTGAMNASYPTQRAIMMDVVEKRARGRWSALENLTSATWTGSAALGGYLLGRVGFLRLYLITGSIYVAAVLLLVPLIPLTAGERVDGDGDGEGASISDPPPADGSEPALLLPAPLPPAAAAAPLADSPLKDSLEAA